MTSDRARATPGLGRFVIDARYVEPKPSGIGRYVEALIDRLPALAPELSFELWTHPARPTPVTAPNVPRLVAQGGTLDDGTPTW